MRPISVPVLTYHSQNVAAREYGANDHVSLSTDLRILDGLGKRVIPVAWLVDWLLGERSDAEVADGVCLTFDDGCDADVADLDFPGWGIQRGFLSILDDFRRETGREAQPHLHATSFVIADPVARGRMDRGALFGCGWLSEDWWPAAQAGGLIDIQNHSWDHNHPLAAAPEDDTPPRGRFDVVDAFPDCDRQVRMAGEYIAARAGKPYADLFAYPYGESSAYLREEYFPGHPARHHTRAAFGCEPEYVTGKADRWNLPRFVCGRDWTTEVQFAALLRDAGGI